MLTAESVNLYQRLYWSWVSFWDSAHYVSIAAEGYKFPQQAFFPLWPFLIKAVSLTGIPPFAANFLLSFLSGLSAFVLFYLLAVRVTGKNTGRYALILFASFPSTMFLHAGYTEGLFLTLTLLSFLMLERKLYLLSAICGGFCTAARLAGIGITAAYFIIKQSASRKIIYMFLSISGLLIYMLFLQLIFGNGLLFADAQKAWCESAGHCQLKFPLDPIIGYGKLILSGWVKPGLSSVFIDWVSSVIFLGFLFIIWKKLNRTYFIYSLFVIILPLMSGSITGMVRYVLAAFPVFLVAPRVIKSRLLFIIICFLLFLLELRFVALFTNRIWVA